LNPDYENIAQLPSAIANIVYIGIYSHTIHNNDFQSFYGLIRVEHSIWRWLANGFSPHSLSREKREVYE